jgi:outer membrane protein OmpA-like peptidoglycan-associated protein
VASDDPKKNGCPLDRDGDGIVDAKDACPDVPGVASDDPKKNGCPSDRDGDGIVDARDACPDEPGVASEDATKNGCPPDRDGDKIVDAKDKCPDVPGLREAPASVPPERRAEWAQRFIGCTDDIDKDGIANLPDACPTEAGKPNKDPLKHGCPLDDKPRVEQCKIKFVNRIHFETGRANLRNPTNQEGKETLGVLQAALDFMTKNPAMTRVEVQGHASQDKYAKNQELSDQRAVAVVKWLTEHGVEGTRLVPKGYGTSQPLPGVSLEGAAKALHQRVEFHILDCDEKASK